MFALTKAPLGWVARREATTMWPGTRSPSVKVTTTWRLCEAAELRWGRPVAAAALPRTMVPIASALANTRVITEVLFPESAAANRRRPWLQARAQAGAEHSHSVA